MGRFFHFLPCLLAAWMAPAQEFERLGVLLDTSGEMGHLVPRARKELRLLNEELKSREREPVITRELEGVNIDQPGKLGLPARKNALVVIQQMFAIDEVDRVYWITGLKGRQTPTGLFLFGKMLQDWDGQLVIRHTWPEQIRAGSSWQKALGDPGGDVLHPNNYPKEWLEPVRDGGGLIIRSWREFPPEFESIRVTPEKQLLRVRLRDPFGLHFLRQNERHPQHPYGRYLIDGSALVPFLDESTLAARNEAVYEAMCRRRTIEEDLRQIPGKRVGVLFALGYRAEDSLMEKRTKGPSRRKDVQYIRQIREISAEIREHRAEHGGNPDRVYGSSFLETKGHGRVKTDADRAVYQSFARRGARMIRDEDLDALYLFTNGFSGGTGYGRFNMDPEPLASYLEESGARLYLRVPFELGVAPIEWRRLAVASGGEVFFGPGDDPDFDTWPLKGAWMESGEE